MFTWLAQLAYTKYPHSPLKLPVPLAGHFESRDKICPLGVRLRLKFLLLFPNWFSLTRQWLSACFPEDGGGGVKLNTTK